MQLFVFAIAFAGIGGFLLWRSYAGSNEVLGYQNVDAQRSVNYSIVTETGRGKRNAQVIQIANNASQTDAKLTISKSVAAGKYQACFWGVAQGGVPSGTFSAREWTTAAGTDLGSTTYTASNTTKYQSIACLTLTHKVGDSATLGFYITDTAANTSLRISTIILKAQDTVTPPPPPPPPTASACSDVAHGQQVGAGNTGVQSGVSLTPSGSIVTSSDGQVIQNLEVSGAISVRHKNVTIRNVRVRAMTDGNGIDTPIAYAGKTGGLLVEYVEIIGVSGRRGAGFLAYSPATVRCTEVTGFQDGFKLTDGQLFENNWCHDLYKAVFSDTGSTHNDCMQAVAANDFVIRRNRLDGPYKASTSAIILKTDKGTIKNGLVEDNWFSGGSYTIYFRIGDPQFGAPTGNIVRGNIWQKNSWTSGALSTDGSPFTSWTNNRYDDGTAFNL